MSISDDIKCNEKDCIHHGIWLECCICCRWNKKIKQESILGDFKESVKDGGY